MNLVIELILDLLVEGGIEISSNPKINKWIRYPILGIIVLLFLTIILGTIFIGIALMDESILGSLFIIGIGVMLLIMGIKKFKKIYIQKNNKR